MDCKQYELFIMQHFDRVIEPENASRLAKHILTCEKCRQLYLTLDEVMDFVSDENAVLSEAPANFTEAVMAGVRAEKELVAATYLTKTNGGSLVSRFIGAFNAVLFGLGITFALNPDILYLLPAPTVENTLSVFSSIGAVLNNIASWVEQAGATLSSESLGITALLFVAVIGTLLFVLHSGEKLKT